MEDLKEKFSKIYDDHIKGIYRFCYLKLGSRDLAEDLASETFTRLWKRLDKTDIDNVRAFLYGIARNVMVDHYRKKRVPTIPLDTAPDIGRDADFVAAASISSDMDQVRKALEGLNDEYQNLIIWRYLDEMSIPEIAKLEGKSEESVRVQLHRAMGQLREKLQ